MIDPTRWLFSLLPGTALRYRRLFAAGILFCAPVASAATITIQPWTPLFQGIDHATGRQQAIFTGERNHAVYALRINLTDPDVRLFGMPRATNWHTWVTNETVSTTATDFLTDHVLQLGI